MFDTIQEFMLGFFKSSGMADHASQKAMRDFFCVEVKGFAEFIGVNGKLYRYGFVSEDDERTRTLARAMFKDDFQQFQHTVGTIQGVHGWEDVHAPELKVHLKNNAASVVALRKILPAPLLLINATSLSWLRGIYGTVERLNTQWGTTFESWSELNGLALEEDSDARGQTQDDISHINHLLTATTQNALMGCGVEDEMQTELDKLSPILPTILPTIVAHFSKHGRIELIFATIGSLLPYLPPDALYTMLLLYIASSFETNTFSPLPPSADAHADATDRAAFLEHYYDTTTRTLQMDWARLVHHDVNNRTIEQLVQHIPASTVQNIGDFSSLVKDIQDMATPSATQSS